MKFLKYLEEKKWLQYTVAACSAVLLFVVLTRISTILQGFSAVIDLLSPVIYGIVIAYLISPLVIFLEKTIFKGIDKENIRHQVSNVAAMVTVIILFVLLMSGLIPQTIESIKMFIANLNIYAEALQGTFGYIVELGEKFNLDMSIFDRSTEGVLNKLVTVITDNTMTIAEGTLSASGNAVNFGLGLILAVYFLIYKKVLVNAYYSFMKAVVPEKRYDKVTGFLSECNRIMTTYVVSDLMDALIIGCLNSVYMMISGTPYLVLISVVVGMTNLIPTFGPFIGAFIAGLILLFASPHSVIPFLIFTLALQLCDGYIIKPRLFGGALGVSGVWIILGIVAGAKLFGFIGVLLSVPIVAIICLIMNGFVGKRLAAREGKGDQAAEADSAVDLPGGVRD